MSVKWHFPSTGGGRKSGLNDGNIETFKDNPYKSMAREVCQNSLDAAFKGKPAIVEFSTFTIDSEDFPDKKGFMDILCRCKEYANQLKNEKTENFFNIAIDKLDRKTISMLRISDFNTTGLTEKDWNDLVEFSGNSGKGGEKLGSFGIGKSAPFACSEFRTVFYSTLTDTEQKSKGVSTLMSFKLGEFEDGSDDMSQATGFWGEVGHNVKPVLKTLTLDKDFSRNSSGTDIFVAAFNMPSKNDFKKKIISEIIDSFLLAIWNGQLEVKVDGTEITKLSLSKVVEEFKDSINPNTVFNLELVSDPSLDWHILPIKISNTLPLGNIKFGFKIRADGTNKISMYRSSGMKILDRTNLCKALRYVGIGIIEGELLGKFLRDLENVSHDKWSLDRAQNPTQAKAILSDINNAMSNKLNEVAASLFDGEIDIEGAGDYLPDEIEDERKKPIPIQQNDFDKIIAIETKVIKKTRSVAHLEADEIGDDLATLGDTQGQATEGEGYEGLHYQGNKRHGLGEKEVEEVGLGNGEDKLKSFITVKAKTIRVFCINKNERLYRVSFIPTESSNKAYLEIFKLAEQNEKMPIEITTVLTNGLTANINKIGYFTLERGFITNIDFKITEPEYSAMEVRIYAHQS